MSEPKNEFEAKKSDAFNEATEQTKLDKFRANITLLRDAAMASLPNMDLIRREAERLGLVLDKGAFEGETALDAALEAKQKEEDAVEEGKKADRLKAKFDEMYSQPERELHSDLPRNVTSN